MTQPPGFLTITAAEYHSDVFGEADRQPALSAGIASILINASPKHAWAAHPRLNPDFKPREEGKFDIGTAAHKLLLEGVENVVVVEADDWRTKAAKETRDLARASGMSPLLEREWEAVKAMVDAAREQFGAFGLDLEPLPFTEGKPEQSIMWHEPNGVCCKARIDWLHDDHSTVDDYKTTSRSASPDTWTRSTLYSIGADVQAAFYLRGLERLTGKRPAWRFVVQETFPPFALSVISLGPDVMELAEAKVDYAITKWVECMTRDEWPAYPMRICWAEAPAWEMSRWLEKEGREEMAA